MVCAPFRSAFLILMPPCFIDPAIPSSLGLLWWAFCQKCRGRVTSPIVNGRPARVLAGQRLTRLAELISPLFGVTVAGQQRQAGETGSKVMYSQRGFPFAVVCDSCVDGPR